METRPLGSTGLTVTPIGLGLAAVGRPAYITLGRANDLGSDRSVEQLRERSDELLDAAQEVGIRYLDTARSYGRAEDFLGSWLRRRSVPPAEVTVGSKWGYRYVGAWRLDAPIHETKDHGRAMLRRQVAESRELLAPWLRLYQIHSATLDSGVLEDASVLHALVALRDDGLVIGLTTSGPAQADTLRAALRVEVDGRNPFAAVQATWNLLEPSVGEALGAAHDAGWGVIVKEAVANGRLARAGATPAALDRVAARHATSADAVAIAAALANPWADVVLSGAATTDQLLSNVGALDVRLTEDDRAELDALREPPERYWSERSALAWA